MVPLPDPSADRRLPHRLIASFSTINLTNCNDSEQVPMFQQLSNGVLKYAHSLDLLEGKELFKSDTSLFNSGSDTPDGMIFIYLFYYCLQ